MLREKYSLTDKRSTKVIEQDYNQPGQEQLPVWMVKVCVQHVISIMQSSMKQIFISENVATSNGYPWLGAFYMVLAFLMAILMYLYVLVPLVVFGCYILHLYFLSQIIWGISLLVQNSDVKGSTFRGVGIIVMSVAEAAMVEICKEFIMKKLSY